MNIHELEQSSPGDYFYDVHDQLRQHVYDRSERAFAAGDAARDAIATREQLVARQHAIRAGLLKSIGGLPPFDTPLNSRLTGTVEGDGFRVEKIIFESRPRHYVTANLYLPHGCDGRARRGAVLFLCGHHREAKCAAEYQRVCRQLVRAGLIVLAQDPIGQGERFSYYEPELGDSTVQWGTGEHEYAGLQCLPLGESIARYFLHDAMRSVDYLRSRPEVDGDRIGVTGNSGGGTQSCLMMLADERIAAAAPTTFLMNRQTYLHCGGAQDAEQIWPGFSAAGFDHEDILIAMAPRPVRVLAVTSDFFPIEGTRRTVERCQRFWPLAGEEQGLDLVEDDSAHAYTPRLARAAAAFFARHLLGQESDVMAQGKVESDSFEPRQLWCTVSGQVRGELEGAAFVHEENQQRLRELEEERAALPAAPRRERALQWLSDRVTRHRRPCELNPRFYATGQVEEMPVQMALWWSQEKIFNHGYAFRHFQFASRKLPVTLAVWDGGTSDLRPHLEWMRHTCEQGRAVVVLDVTGAGALMQRSLTTSPPHDFFGVMHKLGDDLLWLDDDLASLRTYDVLRALTMIEQWPGLDATDLQLYTHERQGIYGWLAAALDERIQSVESVEVNSYRQWVAARHYDTHTIKSIIPYGVLHYFDLPEIKEWLTSSS